MVLLRLYNVIDLNQQQIGKKKTTRLKIFCSAMTVLPVARQMIDFGIVIWPSQFS